MTHLHFRSCVCKNQPSNMPHCNQKCWIRWKGYSYAWSNSIQCQRKKTHDLDRLEHTILEIGRWALLCCIRSRMYHVLDPQMKPMQLRLKLLTFSCKNQPSNIPHCNQKCWIRWKGYSYAWSNSIQCQRKKTHDLDRLEHTILEIGRWALLCCFRSRMYHVVDPQMMPMQ